MTVEFNGWKIVAYRPRRPDYPAWSAVATLNKGKSVYGFSEPGATAENCIDKCKQRINLGYTLDNPGYGG